MIDHADAQIAAGCWDEESQRDYEQFLDYLAEKWEFEEHGRREMENIEVAF